MFLAFFVCMITITACIQWLLDTSVYCMHIHLLQCNWLKVWCAIPFWYKVDGAVLLLTKSRGKYKQICVICKNIILPFKSNTKVKIIIGRVTEILGYWSVELYTRNKFDMYSFVSQSWCAFWQKNDMLLKWSIVKSTSEPKPQRKAYHLKDTALLCDF